jgi:hypothetical protein
MASSAAATPVPRSLCGWTDSTMLSRRLQVAVHPLDHVGKDVGRGMLHRGRQVDDALCGSGVGCHTSVTASHALGERQLGAEKLSGEY